MLKKIIKLIKLIVMNKGWGVERSRRLWCIEWFDIMVLVCVVKIIVVDLK